MLWIFSIILGFSFVASGYHFVYGVVLPSSVGRFLILSYLPLSMCVTWCSYLLGGLTEFVNLTTFQWQETNFWQFGILIILHFNTAGHLFGLDCSSSILNPALFFVHICGAFHACNFYYYFVFHTSMSWCFCLAK